MNKFSKSIELSLALYKPESRILRCQHFSFIFYKDRLISIGQNNNKTNPIHLINRKISKEGKNVSSFAGTCSEYDAARKLKRLTNIPFNKCILINIRVDNNRRLNFSKPCGSCRNLLEYLEFKEVYFSNESGQFEQYY